ncbi:hypothetical protein [Domibacillus iocasae]|uniref:Uncharacterized protein n=1 Tax=Domibacillus iocasae TaxID=1714016 RepID=A0A1E7DR03_9BACI|nr:hypothetical protein [Domibacillus iocasae]OES45522.1 hypothetical protein BA724_01505 [Domibacillus iocasae]
MSEGTEEKPEAGGYVEVVSPLYWYEDERYEIGKRFVIKSEHINRSFKKCVKKIRSLQMNLRKNV